MWLPATGPDDGIATADGVGGGAAQYSPPGTFITDLGEGEGRNDSTITLTALQQQIADQEAEFERGEGIEGYELCVVSSIFYGQEQRAEEARTGAPWRPWLFEETVLSGAVAGQVVTESKFSSATQYHEFWLSGVDAGLFNSRIIDGDSDPGNGFRYVASPARPLPAGQYRFYDHLRLDSDFPCDFYPDKNYIEFAVTAEPPAGSVHEAFFDPVAMGAAVGADNANGVMKPTSFTVNGAAAGLDSLKWEAGSVALTLSPHVSLAGHALDIIELDGSVSLSLEVEDASLSGGVLTWGVETQPWQAGDLLMLRIRQGKHDADSDGLIEVENLAQLNAIRWDLDGDGAADSADNGAVYARCDGW